MKSALFALAILLMAFSPTSTVSFSNVRGSADPNSDSITIDWSTSQEDGIKDFAVEKASQLDNQFYELGKISPTGSGSTYQYADKGIYKTTSTSIFRYRVRADGSDGNVDYSTTITVTYSYSQGLSGVAKRTWGSIKAMFR